MFRQFSTKSKIVSGTRLLAALYFVPSACILLARPRAAEPVQGTVAEAMAPA